MHSEIYTKPSDAPLEWDEYEILTYIEKGHTFVIDEFKTLSHVGLISGPTWISEKSIPVPERLAQRLIEKKLLIRVGHHEGSTSVGWTKRNVYRVTPEAQELFEKFVWQPRA